MENNLGWKRNISIMEYSKQYESWEKSEKGLYSMVMSEIIKGENKSSLEIASEFDDISKGNFYYRDWTKDTMPFVNVGEIYWCGFWFQYYSDAKKFVKMFGGVGNWMEEYKEFEKACNNKRNGKLT